MHADCKRVARVTKVRWFGGTGTGVVWSADISFRYEKGPGTQRRWAKTPPTEQTMNIEDWARLFSTPAPPKETT